jgi:hypothetical protein
MAQSTIARRDFLAGMLGAGAVAAAQTGRPPNIILILTDDQGWWDLGLHGNRDISTPVMDHLAAVIWRKLCERICGVGFSLRRASARLSIFRDALGSPDDIRSSEARLDPVSQPVDAPKSAETSLGAADTSVCATSG